VKIPAGIRRCSLLSGLIFSALLSVSELMLAQAICEPNSPSELANPSAVFSYQRCQFLNKPADRDLSRYRMFSTAEFAVKGDWLVLSLAQLEQQAQTQSKPILLVANGFDDFALLSACNQRPGPLVYVLRGGPSRVQMKTHALELPPAKLSLATALRFATRNAVVHGRFSKQQSAFLRKHGLELGAARRQSSAINHFVFSDVSHLSKRVVNTYQVDASSESFFKAIQANVQGARIAAQTQEIPCYLKR
jgi:hypothetical protein